MAASRSRRPRRFLFPSHFAPILYNVAFNNYEVAMKSKFRKKRSLPGMTPALQPATRALSGLVCFLTLIAPAMGQSQITFVDVNRVLSESAQGKSEAARLNTLISQRTSQINTERDTLSNLQKRISEGALSLSQGEIGRLQREGQAINTKIQRMQEDAQAELDSQQNAVLQRLSENLRILLVELGKERSYAAVFLKSLDRQIFVADALDITDEVIQLYDTRFPAG